ncbi:hypothetical protein D516_2097 [Rhodobacter sp. AKP1]|nr:hypothetical protein D516_2097 [Rhodobacter sp. AKP1]
MVGEHVRYGEPAAGGPQVASALCRSSDWPTVRPLIRGTAWSRVGGGQVGSAAETRRGPGRT